MAGGVAIWKFYNSVKLPHYYWLMLENFIIKFWKNRFKYIGKFRIY